VGVVAVERARTSELAGDDHYARFYRHLTNYLDIDPELYERAISNVYIAFPPSRWSLFFDALSEYIEGEVRERTGAEISVTHETSDDYRTVLLKGYMDIEIAGETKKLLLDIAEFKWGRIASGREEFNEEIEDIVSLFSDEAKKILRATKK